MAMICLKGRESVELVPPPLGIDVARKTLPEMVMLGIGEVFRLLLLEAGDGEDCDGCWESVNEVAAATPMIGRGGVKAFTTNSEEVPIVHELCWSLLGFVWYNDKRRIHNNGGIHPLPVVVRRWCLLMIDCGKLYKKLSQRCILFVLFCVATRKGIFLPSAVAEREVSDAAPWWGWCGGWRKGSSLVG